MSAKGRPRIYCSAKAEGLDCTNKGTFLDIYEAQLEWYLEHFIIPDDYQAKILQEHNHLESAHAIDWHARKEALQSRLRKLRELYEWGHLDDRDYLGRYEDTQRDLDGIAPAEESGNLLDRLAQFLASMADAWRAASQEQRNKLARSLFEEIYVEDSRVVLVKPRP